jgi:hypothetical protein
MAVSIDRVGLGLPGGMPGWALLRSRKPTDFAAFTRDPQLQRDLAYLREKLPTKATAKELMADPRLQRIVLQAYGLDSQIGMDALMRKVLESDPADSSSVAARMTDPRYRQVSNALNYGGIGIPAIPALASQARITVDGLNGEGAVTSVSGRFAGLDLRNLDTSGASSRAELAAELQQAFRRADGGRSDISVTVRGLDLVLSDAKGRGGAQGFSFVTAGGVQARLRDTTAGRQATPASGGPKVTDAATIKAIADRYVQARFEAVVGSGSDTLRAALYAKRTLPGVTSWYSVLADTNLSRVVRGALGLPDAMATMDVDRQVAVLKSRMNIQDFQDPAKLGRMLDRFVALSAAKETSTTAASGIAALIQPLSW